MAGRNLAHHAAELLGAFHSLTVHLQDDVVHADASLRGRRIVIDQRNHRAANLFQFQLGSSVGIDVATIVLVLFGDGVRGPDLLYIQRSERLRRHPGQPGFPGGRMEEADDGPVAAALREAVEETGLDPVGVDVLATLPEMFVARSEFRVMPVLGWWRMPSAVRQKDLGEVAAVERIGVADLADPANRLMMRFPGGRSGPASASARC